jgi:glutaminyl-peptide cyclotransferase
MKLAPYLFALALALGCNAPGAQEVIHEYGYEIVREYPHDPQAFTQGLFVLDGFLYESTGLLGQSSLRKVSLESGRVVARFDMPKTYWQEGIVNWKQEIVGLSWQQQTGHVFDLHSLQPKRKFRYPGEGWGLTQDGTRIIMSDGTAELRFWDPTTLKETGRLQVTFRGNPVIQLNELEWVKGEILANIWQTDLIARINPANGKVTGWINLAGLLKPSDRVAGQTDVLNGIAYDAKRDRLFVTGKNWPKLFHIRLVKARALTS